MRLNNKNVVITGAARGLGETMALRFVEEGAKVIAIDIDQPGWSNERIDFYKVDITDAAACTKFFNEIIEKYQKIDILVNNAGITKDAMTKKMTTDQWDRVIAVNLTGVFNLTRLIGPEMEKHGKGAIINISSIVGEYGNIGQINYAASKAGLIGMTKTWAKEFAFKGAQVRVNAISPGYIMTDMLKTVRPELLDAFIKQTMLNRLGKSKDIANAALFLASDEASYITGQVLGVNGGLRL